MVTHTDILSDLVVVVFWGGFVNLQQTFSSTLLDILNEAGLQDDIVDSLSSATPDNLDTFKVTEPWATLRSAMFESIRLCGFITGPGRLIMEDVPLATEPNKMLPKGQVADLSSFYTHRMPSLWGDDAAEYRPNRFMKTDPPIGSPSYIIWGLEGPHTCPGRWFGQALLQIMTKGILERYSFEPDRKMDDSNKYVYTASGVLRAKVGMSVTRRK